MNVSSSILRRCASGVAVSALPIPGQLETKRSTMVYQPTLMGTVVACGMIGVTTRTGHVRNFGVAYLECQEGVMTVIRAVELDGLILLDPTP